MQQGLLSEQMPQDAQMVQEEPMPQGGDMGMGAGAEAGMSDVDMAVEQAMASGALEDVGVGVEMASEEEQAQLDNIMDAIETKLHGELTQDVVGILEAMPEPFQGISQASYSLVMGSFDAASRNGLEPLADLYLAENGVVQQTVEMVFEFAEAMGKVTVDDDEVLSAAYMDTLRQIGENMLESENPMIRESAQELMVELELDTPIGPEDYAEPEELAMMEQPTGMGPEMAQGPSQAPSGPLPPMGPEQGMI